MRFRLALASLALVCVAVPGPSAVAKSWPGKAAKPGYVGKPRGLQVRAATDTSLSLAWHAPRSGKPRRYLVVADGRRVASSRAGHIRISGLRCGRRYRLGVVAVVSKHKRSRSSKRIAASTSGCPEGAGAATVTASAASATPSLARLLSDDMSLSSEVAPHGITGDFAFKPRLSAGINPGGYTGFTGWGQLYECATGNPQPAARVQLTSIEAWIKSKATGKWTRVQASSTTEGDAYSESYVNNTSKRADAKSFEGTTTVTAGGGFNYHFWPATSRVAINPNDVAGVVTNVRARLLPGSFTPGSQPCYVLSSGADYWSSPNAGWNQLLTNTDVGIGRFKRVDANWRLFTMSTTNTGPLPDLSYAAPAELR